MAKRLTDIFTGPVSRVDRVLEAFQSLSVTPCLANWLVFQGAFLLAILAVFSLCLRESVREGTRSRYHKRVGI